MTPDQFLTRERDNLIALIHEMKETYGRLPAEFVVGPPVDAFDDGMVKFAEIPFRWEPECAGGQVLALLGASTMFDRKAAMKLRQEQRKEALRLAVESGRGRL